ncbi:MAG: hypothetical protein ACOX0E_07425 [Syntrophomonadaceae bacterium]|jgi:cellulose biosynthesis protein BcsQ
MRAISLISAHPQAGKTTLAVNLASGCSLKGLRAALATPAINGFLFNWLGINPPAIGQISNLPSPFGFDIMTYDYQKDPYEFIKLINFYDLIFFDTANTFDSQKFAISCSDLVLLCTQLAPEEVPSIVRLNNKLLKVFLQNKSIDLIVPNRINTREWAENTQHLMSLAHILGPDKIADMIPACAAIHDLPLEKESVWNLPSRYQNRKDAFSHLLQAIGKAAHIESLY